MGKYQRNLAKLYMDQKKVVEDEKDYREKLRANYKK